MLVSTAESYRAMLGELEKRPYMVCDLETTGLDPWNGDRLIGVSIHLPDEGGGDARTYYVPFRHETGGNLPIEELHRLRPLLMDPDRVFVGFNAKFDRHFLARELGEPIRNQTVDVMLAAHLANENEPTFALKALGAKYVDPEAGQAEAKLMELLKSQGLGKQDMHQLPPKWVAPYAEQDSILTWQLGQNRQAELEAQGLLGLWDEVNIYSDATEAMERHGALVDPAKCAESLIMAKDKQAEIHQQMVGMVGHDFNPASVPQLRKILGQQATDREALAECKHPIAKLLLEHRAWSRAAGTYYQGFMDRLDGNNRLHPNLKLTGTISGRLSCNKPNLQALPRGDDVYKVRDLVIAPPGHVLMAWDWSQAELRLLAHYTLDPFLLDAYRNDKDIHQETSDLLRIPRYQAKRVNFGIVYGIGPGSLAKQIDSTYNEAKAILNRYHKMIPGVRRLSRLAEDTARKTGRVPMWTGRLRHIEDEEEMHKAMSNLIQGGVAEMMRVAVTRLHQTLEGTGVHMILQVHDEILFELPEDEWAKWSPVIRDTMQDFGFAVPILADGKVGRSWGAMHRISFDNEDKPVLPKGAVL